MKACCEISEVDPCYCVQAQEYEQLLIMASTLLSALSITLIDSQMRIAQNCRHNADAIMQTITNYKQAQKEYTK